MTSGLRVHVLNRVQQLHTFRKGPLKKLSEAGNEPGASGPFVNAAVTTASSKSFAPEAPAAVDQSCAPHVTIRDLVAAKIDRMIAREFRIDALVKFPVARVAHVQRLVAAVVLGQLLLDDVRFNRHAQMIGLTRQVRGEVIVLILLEGVVTHIAPQNRSHPQFVRVRERPADFHDLPVALIGPEVDGRPDRRRAQVMPRLHVGEEYLIKFIRVGQQFVVIDLHDERNFVRVLAATEPRIPKSGCHRVATALDHQAKQYFRHRSSPDFSRSWRPPSARCPDPRAEWIDNRFCPAGHDRRSAASS